MGEPFLTNAVELKPNKHLGYRYRMSVWAR